MGFTEQAANDTILACPYYNQGWPEGRRISGAFATSIVEHWVGVSGISQLVLPVLQAAMLCAFWGM